MSAANVTTTGQAVSGLGRDWSPFRHIPGPDGITYKSESRRDGELPGELERWTVWHRPDPRQEPHTHPWPFASKICSGGYLESRYVRSASGRWEFSGEDWYKEGDIVLVGENVAHSILEILPGTVTHMLIGRLFGGPQDWGYLNTHTHTIEPAVASPEFLKSLRELNAKPPEVSTNFRELFSAYSGRSR